jgi:hypothetical protein
MRRVNSDQQAQAVIAQYPETQKESSDEGARFKRVSQRLRGLSNKLDRYARGGAPGPLAFGNARPTDRRAGRRWLFCREECKQRDSNHSKDHNVLWAILPVHPVRHGLRRHDCHREPMGKA